MLPEFFSAIEVGKFEFNMRRDSAHERGVEVGNKIRRENHEVLIIIHEHEHNRARLIHADIIRAVHVGNALA